MNLFPYPEERGLAVLVAEIEKATLADGDLETALSPQAAYAVVLQRQVRDDYRHGALVSVSSWLLSYTEARFYAAAAMFRTLEVGDSVLIPHCSDTT